ncbi:MAG: hypothetical protein M1269_13105 [Chloroflexi bacterium]|nr:hypothetical protein [Chloroflexota bacterium]
MNLSSGLNTEISEKLFSVAGKGGIAGSPAVDFFYSDNIDKALEAVNDAFFNGYCRDLKEDAPGLDYVKLIEYAHKKVLPEPGEKSFPLDKLYPRKSTELLTEDFPLLADISSCINWENRNDINRKFIEDVLKKFSVRKKAVEKLEDKKRPLYYLNAAALFFINYSQGGDARFFDAQLWAFDFFINSKNTSAGCLMTAGILVKLSTLLFVQRTGRTGFHPLPGGYD